LTAFSVAITTLSACADSILGTLWKGSVNECNEPGMIKRDVLVGLYWLYIADIV